MDPFDSVPAVKSLRSKFEQLATSSGTLPTPTPNAAVTKVSLQQGPSINGTAGGNVSGKLVIRRRPSLDNEILVGEAASSSGPWVDMSSAIGDAIKRPPPPAPTGIKRPPPPPPGSSLSQPLPIQPSASTSSLTTTQRRVSPSKLSTSPSRGAGGKPQVSSASSSPAVSPLLRPVPAPPASASTSSLNGSLRTSSSRSPSRNGASSDTSFHEEMDELSQAPSIASLKSKFNDTPPKTNTSRQSLSTSYPKPIIPPRPSKPIESSTSLAQLLSSSPEPFTSPQSINVTPPRCMLSSPFSDDEAEAEQLNLTAPLIPAPPSTTRKPPPPKPPAGISSARSSDTYSSNSSQSSVETSSVTSSTQRVPPPRPPPRTRPKSLVSVNDPPSSPIPSSSSLKSINPPPLPTRRLNPDPEPTSATLQNPPPRISNRTSQPPPQPPSSASKQEPSASQSPVPERKSLGSSKLPPPPTRTIALGDKLPPARRSGGGSPPLSSDDESGEEGAALDDSKSTGSDSLPDTSRSSRRPPLAAPFRDIQPDSVKIPIQPYSGHFVVAGSLVAVSSHHHIRIYDLSVADVPMYTIDTKDLGLQNGAKVTCMEMKSVGDGALGQGFFAWVGTKEGHVFEVNLRTGGVGPIRQAAHLHPVTHILRHGRSMVTLDEGGKALVYTEGEGSGGALLTGTQHQRVVRITEKQDFVRMLGGKLWTAARADNQSAVGGGALSRLPIIRVYDVFVPGSTGRSVVPTEHVGAVTSAAVVPSQPGKVFVGHEEGYVSVWAADGTEDGYPRCLEVVKVSTTDVLCLEGVNDRLWVGSRNGMISAYEVAARPWVVTNSWSAHPGLPVLKLAVDVFGVDEGRLNVVSAGRDETLRFWDGLLGSNWIENELQKMERSFSSFKDVTALIMSWNCDASRPDSLTGSHDNLHLFGDVLSSVDEPPDIIVFGFQEVIDLESRKMTAKNVLLGGAGKKKHNDESVTGIACSNNGLSDKVTGAYRRWYDRLIREVRVAIPEVSYTVVSTESLVGLFSCILMKTTERFGLRDVAVTTIKRGMGGRYGNKGGIVARFVIGDSSVCMINCHLAAGQNAVRRRNADITAILEEKGVFPPTDVPFAYIGGGDGTTILDHEIVFVNGDLNYRIDHRREAILSSIRAGEFANLLAHDQLLREIKFNRGCRVRGFTEGLITFAPTYKYDPRSNEYDSSEKRRLPAWCDRVLWRTRDASRVQQLHYRRYEANVSDHRPISAAFRVTIKTIKHDLRGQALKQVHSLWAEEQARLLAEARKFYRSYVYL